MRHGYDSVSRRAVVSAPRKLQLLSGVLTRIWRAPDPGDLTAPALPQNQFLVDAVTAHEAQVDEQHSARGLRHGVRWSIELFAALDERPRKLA